MYRPLDTRKESQIKYKVFFVKKSFSQILFYSGYLLKAAGKKFPPQVFFGEHKSDDSKVTIQY